jgi:predicted small secreted protein
MRKVVSFALLAGVLLVSACNTIQGAGRDVSSAGDAVSNAAAPAK